MNVFFRMNASIKRMIATEALALFLIHLMACAFFFIVNLIFKMVFLGKNGC